MEKIIPFIKVHVMDFITIIMAIRLFLLDKKYCEFKIDSNKLLSHHIHSDKDGYEITIIDIKLKLVKDDIYDLVFTKQDKNKNTKYVEFKEGNILNFNLWVSKVETVRIKYKDSLNNEYSQKMKVSPIFNGKKSKSFNVELGNRRWNFFNSFKRLFK